MTVAPEHPPALLATLAGEYYTSQPVFAAEQDQIFEEHVVLRRSLR